MDHYRSPLESKGLWPLHKWLTKLLAAAALVLLVAGCVQSTSLDEDSFGDSIIGMVGADEPHAALIGREVLNREGSAADAIVAMYFAMAVTLPSSAGLGGGGICIAFDHSGMVEALDFLPRSAGHGRAAVPGAVRGMAALHARYGSLRWEQLLVPAEKLARFGTTVSRALAEDIAAAGDKLAADPRAHGLFLSPGGGPKREGDRLVQLDLARVLSNLRTRGASYLYAGAFAQGFAAAATDGLPLALKDLEAYRADFRETTVVDLGDWQAHFGAPRAASEPTAAAMLRSLEDLGDNEDATEVERTRQLIKLARSIPDGPGTRRVSEGDGRFALYPAGTGEEPAERMMADYAAPRQDGNAAPSEAPRADTQASGIAGLVAADRMGNAVACTVTMVEAFGTGRIVPGTGIILAAPFQGQDEAVIAPMLVTDTSTPELYFLGVPSGDQSSSTALVDILLRVTSDEMSLEQAMSSARIHYDQASDTIWYEPDARAAVLAAIGQRDYHPRQAATLGRVNAIFCPDGLIEGLESCEIASDPRGHGLSKIASSPIATAE